MVNLQKDMDSLSAPLPPTWQERQQTIAEAWTAGREKIFNEFVSRQPLIHLYCDNCHTQTSKVEVRCMTCKQHLCHKCDMDSHFHAPFHRRLLVSSESLQSLLPDNFIDEHCKIITKGESKKI